MTASGSAECRVCVECVVVTGLSAASRVSAQDQQFERVRAQSRIKRQQITSYARYLGRGHRGATDRIYRSRPVQGGDALTRCGYVDELSGIGSLTAIPRPESVRMAIRICCCDDDVLCQ